MNLKTLQAEWFWARFCEKQNVEQTLAALDHSVAKFGLKQFVKEVCVQTLPGTRHRKGEVNAEDFWLYIGIVGYPRNLVPPEIKPYPPFNKNGFVDVPASQMVNILTEWLKRTEGKVLYRPPEPLFAPVPSEDGEDAAVGMRTYCEILSDTRQYDRLLTLLATEGSGEYRRLVVLCRALFPNRTDIRPGQVSKRLRMLGHIAESQDRTHWRVLPPLFVPTEGDDGVTRYILIGARDTALRVSLHEALYEVDGILQEDTQPLGDAPCAWYVSVPNNEALQSVAQKTGAGICDDYVVCVERLPNLDGFRAALPVATVGDGHYYDFRLFDGQGFQSLSFDSSEGFYEIWSQPDAPGGAKRERAVYFDKCGGCWRSGDWYSLRYLHRSSRGDSACLMYRAGGTGETELLCPDAYRLPERYEQALVIASGKLPTTREDDRGNRKRVFNGVPRRVAEIVAAKINAQLIG